MKIEMIDRAIYERIRVALVSAGLLPDSTLFPDTQSFLAAKEVLRSNLADGQIVEISGVGSSYARGGKTSCRVIIDNKGETDGTISCLDVRDYESYTDVNGKRKFNKMLYPPVSKNVSYEIRFIATSIQKERLLKAILNTALSSRKTLKGIKDDGSEDAESFVLKRTGLVNVSSVDNISEYMYSYLVVDVWLEEKTLLRANIPTMDNVTIEVNLENSKSEVVDKEIL